MYPRILTLLPYRYDDRGALSVTVGKKIHRSPHHERDGTVPRACSERVSHALIAYAHNNPLLLGLVASTVSKTDLDARSLVPLCNEFNSRPPPAK